MCVAEREKKINYICVAELGRTLRVGTCNEYQILILLLLFFIALSENILRSTYHIGEHIHIILEWHILNKTKKSVSVATTKHTLVDDHDKKNTRD